MGNYKKSPRHFKVKVNLLIIGVFISTQVLGQLSSLSTHVGKKEGFPESTVYDILQDKKGFMWYGTSGVLWRYGGYQHKLFHDHPKNPNSLSHNFVTCLIVDREVSLCAGTLDGGLNKFDPAANSFYRFKHDEKDSTCITSILRRWT